MKEKDSVEDFTRKILPAHYQTSDQDEGRAMMANIHIMAGSRHFIGAQSSNVGRLVYEIMSTKWEIVPYTDVKNWGFVYGAVPKSDERPPPMKG